jgi:hypothetical protein
MPKIIIDPTNENVALVNGSVGFAIRIGPPSDQPPTKSDVDAWPIIGYTTGPLGAGDAEA